MSDVCYQHFNGKVGQASGINVANQTKIEVHQYFFSKTDRRKLHNELMAFQKSDLDFFKSLQATCIAMRGDYMFIKLNDADFKTFYEIKNILFSFYQEKENYRLSLAEEKAKVTKLEMDIAIERNRVALFQQEVEKANNRGLGKIFRRFFGK